MQASTNRAILFLVTPRVGLWRCLRFVGLLALVTLLVLPFIGFMASALPSALRVAPNWVNYLTAGALMTGGVLGMIVKIGGVLLLIWHSFYGIPHACACDAVRKKQLTESNREGRP